LLSCIKKHLEEKLTDELTIIAKSIENDILNTKNLDNLEKELNSANDIPSSLEMIFRDNIYNVYLLGIENDNNNIFICNKNGII
jgi:hypothetical protein